jgi:hypothetical protein
VPLADDLVERARPHALGERRPGRRHVEALVARAGARWLAPAAASTPATAAPAEQIPLIATAHGPPW